MSEEKKKKSKIISFRVNENEYDVIAGIAKSANMNISEYLKVRALEGKVQQPKVASEDLRAIVPELTRLTGQIGRIGNNVNQSAKAIKKVGPYGFFSSSDYLKLTEVFEKSTAEIAAIREEVKRLWHTLK
ncbi:plasmid mobilization protein [Macrococcus bovicus]|uniref:plasmid mobilization protein n=1 Tax=Macrococcus bovicus TaxID=69968 RepID=UPI001AA095D3|nr:hypothetical protein [Macrococcus bovicus]